MSDNPLNTIYSDICGCTYQLGLMDSGHYMGRVVVDRCEKHDLQQRALAKWLIKQTHND